MRFKRGMTNGSHKMDCTKQALLYLAFAVFAYIYDLDQPGHSIKIIAFDSVDFLGLKLYSSGQQMLWSHLPDAKADLCLRWAYTPLKMWCIIILCIYRIDQK